MCPRLSGTVEERSSVMMETAALVVPVTTLEFLREEYLLTGTGSLAREYKTVRTVEILLNY